MFAGSVKLLLLSQLLMVLERPHRIESSAHAKGNSMLTYLEKSVQPAAVAIAPHEVEL